MHPQAMVFRIAAPVAPDDGVVAGLQRLTRDTLAVQLEASATNEC
jgi:hypothetical protein